MRYNTVVEGTCIPDSVLRVSTPSLFAENPHESRGEHYLFTPTIDYINVLRDKGWVVTKAMQQKTRNLDRRPYTRHLVRLSHPNFITDELRQEIVVVNAHDGTSRFKMMGGLFRTLCS